MTHAWVYLRKTPVYTRRHVQECTDSTIQHHEKKKLEATQISNNRKDNFLYWSVFIQQYKRTTTAEHNDIMRFKTILSEGSITIE